MKIALTATDQPKAQEAHAELSKRYDIVDAINAVGATPSDLVAILEALKVSGALRAQLIII